MIIECWGRVRSVGICLLACGVSLGCEGKEVTQCRSSYLSTHALVSSVETKKLESVQQALTAVDSSLELCEAASLREASLREELKQLKKARTKLQSHQSYLIHEASKKKLSPAELNELQKKGDPACPKGQAYRYESSEKQIRCTGPQIADMNWRQADTYFTSRGYKIIKQDSRLRAEYGSESYTYSFSQTDDTRPAKCLTMFAAPGVAWQEAAARVTGVPPQRLQLGRPIKTKRRDLALGVIPDQQQAIIKLGDCEK